MKSKKKPKKVKPRVKVAPPSKRHKSAKDYDRKLFNKKDCEVLNGYAIDTVEPIEFKEPIIYDMDKKEQVIKSYKSKYTWVDSFLWLFGFKRQK